MQDGSGYTSARVSAQLVLAETSPVVMSVEKVITAPVTDSTVRSVAFGKT